MKLLIHGRNLELTQSLRDYTKLKIDKATHNFQEMVQEADVHLSVARNPRVPQQTAEVTVFANGTVIRAQERSENLYASIDLVANKLARQLRKYKERHNNHNVHNNQSTKSVQNKSIQTLSPSDYSLIEGKEPHLPSPGVRRKYFEMKPMTIDQARVQLDLIDHDFYLFREEEGSALRVIYRRNHGGYGVIQEKV
tara:strand:- start:126 stop:710 length:585 start_codon:yes stop_codon:yes gene_type:complete